MIALEPRLGHSEAISTMALTRVDVVSLVSPLLCPTAASHLFSFTSCLLFTTRTRINKKRKKKCPFLPHSSMIPRGIEGEEPVRKIAKRNLSVSERE